MTQEQIADSLYDLQFAADRSKRYHAYRVDFHRGLCLTIQIVNCIAASAAFAKALDGWPLVKSCLCMAAALLSGVAAYQCLSKKIESHAEKKAKFGDLKMMFPVDLEKGTEEIIARIRDAREAIEKDDTRGFHCLDVLTHNEELQARGIKGQSKPLNWFQRILGCTVIPLSYRE